MKKTALRSLIALSAAAALLAGCSSGGGSDNETTPSGTETTAGDDSGALEPATLVVWHNNTTGKGPQFWDDTVAAWNELHPEVTIELQPVQNEDLDGKLQTALNGGDAPDVFLQRGGGKLRDMVDAGFVLDITDDIDAPGIPEGAFGGDTYQGRIYAMPTTILPGGLFYSKDLFAQAGITETPVTLDEFNDAVAKLKAAGIQPIALGAKDAWPAAHWYYWFALRECSAETLEAAGANQDLSDPCFLKAGQDLADFAATEPFNAGFLTTPAQQGAGSSAGLVANHQAAMELMGAWDPGVIGSLTPDGENLPDLGFFPFPTVEGGEGDQTAMMAGMDAFSCSSQAPKEQCIAFLNFLATKEIQEGYATAMSAPPANSEAAGVVTEPSLIDVVNAYEKAGFVSLWLDTILGQNVGNALNTGVVDMLAGKTDPAGIIAAVETAVAKG